eukprot:TRINITY_DN10050_c0_g1_i4.p1 TRINITY_DN10050_c0_g1~~TRINITY_DN10050_c0_g1_i4.p1  ORF type:complete len:246 (-),score=60.79 TRINITY_DN10050_c0_g1_i4:203-940(-)
MNLKDKIISNRFQLENGIRCNIKNNRGVFLSFIDSAFVPKVDLVNSLQIYANYSQAELSVHEKLKGIPCCHLTEDEIKTILFFTFEIKNRKEIYFTISQLLAKRKNIDSWSNYLFFLNRALLKCPMDYGKVFHVIKSEANILKNVCYIPGKYVFWHTFTCCTKNHEVVMEDLSKESKPYNILFEIEQYGGRNISLFSLVPWKEEVVLFPNILFKVVEVNQESDFFLVVKMQEIVGQELIDMIEIH